MIQFASYMAAFCIRDVAIICSSRKERFYILYSVKKYLGILKIEIEITIKSKEIRVK